MGHGPKLGDSAHGQLSKKWLARSRNVGFLVDMATRHVFVSYCHEDQAEVGELVEGLEQRGLTIWWDKKLTPGQILDQEIGRALKASYAAVLCISSSSIARRTSGIFPEYARAIGEAQSFAPGECFLFPVRLEDCEIPYIQINAVHDLGDLLYLDYFSTHSPPRKQEALDKLAAAIKTSPRHP